MLPNLYDRTTFGPKACAKWDLGVAGPFDRVLGLRGGVFIFLACRRLPQGLNLGTTIVAKAAHKPGTPLLRAMFV